MVGGQRKTKKKATAKKMTMMKTTMMKTTRGIRSERALLIPVSEG
jgi:hypothetical protein